MTQRATARALAAEYLNQGDPLGWFEALYSQAAGEQSMIPWADMAVNPNLAGWLRTRNFGAAGETTTTPRALVVGCGLGDDAEAVAELGFLVTAFDVSRSCIEWCRRRFPKSPVEYVVADVFDLPRPWNDRYEFVVEAYTLQVLPAELRPSAICAISRCVAPEGTLLVITRGRDQQDDSGKMPWPVTREELKEFPNHGCDTVAFEDYVEAEDPPVRRFRVEYRRR